MKYFKRLLILIMFVAIVFAGKFTIVGYLNYSYVMNDIGLEKTVEEVMNKSTYVGVDEISDTFLEAVISTEDKRFYQHAGIDYISIGRAVLIDIKEMSFKTGGSTITQQLAKNLFLSFDKTLDRKITEYFLAQKIEELYDKDTIIALYVNVINYGDGCFGVSDASYHYFDKSPLDLEISESVLLAGLPQSPANLSLTKYYDRAVVRSEVVLQSMVNNDILNENEAIQIIAIIKEGAKE